MKTLRKILFYTVLTLGVVFIALFVSVLLFKDKIINEFVRQANTHLNTPVKVGKMDVTILQKFPHLSIVLTDVYVEDSHPGQYPLLTAKKIAFQMNLLEVWRGQYRITGVKIEDCETHLKINAKNESNYSILKKAPKETDGNFGFEIADIDISKTRVQYYNLPSKQELIFASPRMKASVKSQNNLYTIETKGKLLAEKIQTRGHRFLSGKTFDIDSKLVYDDNEKSLDIQPSTLHLNHSAFRITGNYRWKDRNLIDLVTTGENTDIQTLLSLLPASVSDQFKQYESKGGVYFQANLRGEISPTQGPSFSASFGLRDATIFHPTYQSRIENANLEGSFATSNVSDLRQAALVLKDISGWLNNESFKANFMVYNFVDPQVICNFKGKVDVSSVLQFYPLETVKKVSGSILADIAFEGKIALLKNKATAQRASTQGTIELQDINLLYGQQEIALKHLNGSLQFNNNDLALSNVSGKLGSSDFLLNGFFKNIITFLLFEDQPIGIEADLRSSFIDLDELFAISFPNTDETSGEPYVFSISRNVNLNFNCHVDRLRYRRFKARKVVGDLLVKNEMAVSRNLSLETMGGGLSLSGIIDAHNNKAIDLVSTLRLKGLHIDSIFYVFENFRQDFIEDRHLKGKVSADVNLEMVLNQHLRLFPETLIADIGATISQGELNNFEPMKKLSRYLDDEGLSRLRFSELKNDIHIENKTIYIPQMDVRSNVTDIRISGTHTFDSRIDYRLVTPLRKRKPQNQEAMLAVEEDQQGGAKLFLKITGTTDNYRIAYDTDAVKRKIISDLKKEVGELKDAFRSKGKKKKKEVELERDDYFDWDN